MGVGEAQGREEHNVVSDMLTGGFEAAVTGKIW